MNSNSFSLHRFSILLFYILVFSLSLYFSFKYNFIDYDLWARLLAGKYIYFTNHPMCNDVFSYTPVHTWYDPEWLSSLIIYTIQSKYSIIGLTILKAVLFFVLELLLIMAIKIRQCNKVYNPYKIFYFIFLMIISLQTGILQHTVRCQMFTFIFFTAWIILLELLRKGKNSYIIILPILMLIWQNIHAGFVCGYGLLVLYLIGEFLNKKPCKIYIITLLLCILTIPVNPWKFEYIRFIFDSLFLDRSWISEWESPFSLSNMNKIYFYKIFVLLTFFSYLFKINYKKLSITQLDKTKILILITLFILSYQHIKHISLFIIGATVFCFEDYYYLYDFIMNKVRLYLQINDITAKKIVCVKDIAAYFIIYCYLIFSSLIIDFKQIISESYFYNYPVKAMDFLIGNKIKGNIYSSFGISSYVAYKGYPNLKIFLDGRQEQVYNIDLFDKSMFLQLKKGNVYKKILEQYPIDILLLSKNDPIVTYLSENKSYSNIYSDSKYIIYAKNELKKVNYSNSDTDISNVYSTIFETKFNIGNNI